MNGPRGSRTAFILRSESPSSAAAAVTNDWLPRAHALERWSWLADDLTRSFGMKLLSLLQGRQMAIDYGLRVEHATLEAFSAGANETPDAARRRLKEWYLAADAARDGRSREGHRSETGEDSPD